MLNEVTVTYEGAMNAKYELPDSGTQTIGAPASCGGTGKEPSPKDLFVAGYASCIVMAMDVAAKKAGFNISGAKITVSPVWAKNEPILEEINTMLVLPQAVYRRAIGYPEEGRTLLPDS